MLLPEGVEIDGASGEISPLTGRYAKRLSDLDGFFRDADALRAMIRAEGDRTVYEVLDYRRQGSDLAFGTTVIEPGRVGDEYFMTRGHFHVRPECGEAYHTQSGEGLLLLETRGGETREVAMQPGVCAFIPPGWAHRSVNTGAERLVFTWFCAIDAGNDYGDIRARGMRRLAVEREGRAAVVANPGYDAPSPEMRL